MQDRRRGLVQAAHAQLALGQPAGGRQQLPALRQHRADDRGQALQHRALVLVELARRAVDHAHGADALAAGHHDGRAGVEADVGLAGDQRVAGEARVAAWRRAPRTAPRRGSRGRRTPRRAASRSTPGRPRLDLNHWRCASISEISAIGTPHSCAAVRVMVSKTGSGSVSSTPSSRSAARRRLSSGTARQRHRTSPTAVGVDAAQRRRIDGAQHVDAAARAAGVARRPAGLALHGGHERLVEAHAVVLVLHHASRPAPAGRCSRSASSARAASGSAWIASCARTSARSRRATSASRRSSVARAPTRLKCCVYTRGLTNVTASPAERERGGRRERLPDRDGVDAARLERPHQLVGCQADDGQRAGVDVVEHRASCRGNTAPSCPAPCRRACRGSAALRRSSALRRATTLIWYDVALMVAKMARSRCGGAGGHDQFGGGGHVDAAVGQPLVALAAAGTLAQLQVQSLVLEEAARLGHVDRQRHRARRHRQRQRRRLRAVREQHQRAAPGEHPRERPRGAHERAPRRAPGAARGAPASAAAGGYMRAHAIPFSATSTSLTITRHVLRPAFLAA